MDRYSYDLVFHGNGADGDARCPHCGDAQIHLTGHTKQLDTGIEYGPDVSLVGWCECGEDVEIVLGNYKGSLALSIRPLNKMEKG